MTAEVIDRLLTPQPGSLIEEAFQAADGTGRHESLEAFAAHCMTNGDLSGGAPGCLAKVAAEGPQLIALSSVRRIVGVGPKTPITEDYDAFYGNIERIQQNIAQGLQPAPFIAEPRGDGWLYLLDGNHTKMALKRHDIARWWAIILKPLAACELEFASTA
jgi:hypothetical protein